MPFAQATTAPMRAAPPPSLSSQSSHPVSPGPLFEDFLPSCWPPSAGDLLDTAPESSGASLIDQCKLMRLRKSIEGFRFTPAIRTQTGTEVCCSTRNAR